MSKVFLTADLHFGHGNIIKYEKRPFANSDEMDKQLVRNWNKKVRKNDTVFVLGDVSFHNSTKSAELVKSLNGHKILIMGNHDAGTTGKYINWGFEAVSPWPIVYNDFIVLSHKPPEYIPPDTPYLYIYGHVHGSIDYPTVGSRSSCVCVERWNYTPVNIDELIEMVGKQNI